MEKRKLVWNLTAFSLFAITLAAVLTFASCNDDGEEPEAETLAGVSQMTEAILTSDVTDVQDSVVIPSGTDVTQIMAGGIFGASPCQNPANSAVDMEEGGKLYFVCVGDESATQGVDAGSWTENSTLTSLTLNLNQDVVPPIGFVLTISSVTKNGPVIKGKIPSVPITKELLEPFYPGVDFPAIVMVSADVTFTQVQ